MTGQLISYLTLFCFLCTSVVAQYSGGLQADALQTLIEELKKGLRMDNTNTDPRHIKNFQLSDISVPETIPSSSGQISLLDRVGDAVGSLPSQNYPDQFQRQSPLLSAILSTKTDNVKDDIGVAKRQGRWDFDYGLGGGRFGKRSHMFADYALGGGRFGRDTNRVLQFDDVTDYENDEE